MIAKSCDSRELLGETVDCAVRAREVFGIMKGVVRTRRGREGMGRSTYLARPRRAAGIDEQARDRDDDVERLHERRRASARELVCTNADRPSARLVAVGRDDVRHARVEQQLPARLVARRERNPALDPGLNRFRK